MVCKSCGRSTSNENANFCDYCGTSFKEVVFIQNEDRADSFKENGVTGLGEKSSNVVGEVAKPISFGNWIGTLLLPLIPFVGPIVYLVMMLVWAFGSDSNESKKNWARASLIVGVVMIILIICLFAFSFMELMNSGFDMDGYMNQMNQFY